MNPADAYNLCSRYQGKMVRIRCNDGTEHVGQITKVDRRMVWINPQSGMGGYGLGWGWGGYGYGPGYGYYRPGFGVGIALGAIVGIGLASAFFW